MATISSLVASVPQICTRADGYSKRRAKNDSVVSFRGPRFPLFSSHSRRLLELGPGRSSLPRKKTNSWEQCISIFGEPLIGPPFPQKHNSISSSFCQSRSSSWQSRGRHRLRTSTPSAFPDRTSFCLTNCKLEKTFVKDLHIPYATVGPDEPHAASTSWPDGILEKQEPDLVYSGVEQTEVDAFLSSELPSHPKLYRGQLKNGLRYLILPNKVPPTRFEAHMEVHVGSIDEEEDEQGIAHMIEHVAFLGSKKREKLLGTGARSNAYTDFHLTVFHIHSPISSKDSDEDLLPNVLDALNEIAFHPKFLSSRVEKERRAILSELQMMNTIDYRVDCQLLQHLHSENKLSKRFPIGLEEQIKKWDVDKVRKFHERWYFPANATLYIVGDIENISKTVYQIEAVFGQTGQGNGSAPTPSAFSAMASFLVPKLSVGLTGNLSTEISNSNDQTKLLKKEKHTVRPPVKHNWSLPGSSMDLKPPQIFQHELIQNFSFNMFCKIPVNKVRTYGDLRNVLMKRIFLSALHFRINTRYKSSNPPFTSIELDHSDSGREGCTVTTLTVTAEPKNWQTAIRVAVHEVRRLKEFGVTKGELTRYIDALLKDSEHLAAMIDNVSSVDNLDFIMESDALGHTVMDQRQGHDSLVAVAGTVTLEENKKEAKGLYGKPFEHYYALGEIYGKDRALGTNAGNAEDDEEEVREEDASINQAGVQVDDFFEQMEDMTTDGGSQYVGSEYEGLDEVENEYVPFTQPSHPQPPSTNQRAKQPRSAQDVANAPNKSRRKARALNDMANKFGAIAEAISGMAPKFEGLINVLSTEKDLADMQGKLCGELRKMEFLTPVQVFHITNKLSKEHDWLRVFFTMSDEEKRDYIITFLQCGLGVGSA